MITAEASHRNWKGLFFTIWGGQAFSLLGSQLVQFALVWYLTKATGSATVLATASLAGFLPQVLLGPVAGALVDRFNRRRVMMGADSLIALATLLLAALFWSGSVQVWHVYALMFVRSAAGSFHWPAMQASTTLMVPRRHYARIQGLNESLRGGMNIGAAPLGALLVSVLPVSAVLLIDVFTALLAVLPLAFILVPQPEAGTGPAAGIGGVWSDMRAGFRYVLRWPALLLILGMAAVVNLVFAPAMSLLPLLVIDYFRGEAFHLAWMQAAWGIGVVAGGLFLSAWGGFRRKIMTSLLGLMIVGSGVAAIGLLPGELFWAAVVLMFAGGVGIPITNGPLMAAVQDAVHPEMQGRVFTLVMTLATAMAPLGLVIAGPLADALGVQFWFLVGGVVTAGMGLAGFFIPALKDFEAGSRPETGPDAQPLSAD